MVSFLKFARTNIKFFLMFNVSQFCGENASSVSARYLAQFEIEIFSPKNF